MSGALPMLLLHACPMQRLPLSPGAAPLEAARTSHGVAREHDGPSREALGGRLQRRIRIGVHEGRRLHHPLMHLRNSRVLKLLPSTSIAAPTRHCRAMDCCSRSLQGLRHSEGQRLAGSSGVSQSAQPFMSQASPHLALYAQQGHLHGRSSHVRQHVPNLQTAPAEQWPSSVQHDWGCLCTKLARLYQKECAAKGASIAPWVKMMAYLMATTIH